MAEMKVKVMEHLKAIFPNRSEQMLLAVIDDPDNGCNTNTMDAIIGKCIGQILDGAAVSLKSNMAEMKVKVMEHLKAIFPNRSEQMLLAVIDDPDNGCDTNTMDAIISKCIGQILDGELETDAGQIKRTDIHTPAGTSINAVFASTSHSTNSVVDTYESSSSPTSCSSYGLSSMSIDNLEDQRDVRDGAKDDEKDEVKDDDGEAGAADDDSTRQGRLPCSDKTAAKGRLSKSGGVLSSTESKTRRDGVGKVVEVAGASHAEVTPDSSDSADTSDVEIISVESGESLIDGSQDRLTICPDDSDVQDTDNGEGKISLCQRKNDFRKGKSLENSESKRTDVKLEVEAVPGCSESFSHQSDGIPMISDKSEAGPSTSCHLNDSVIIISDDSPYREEADNILDVSNVLGLESRRKLVTRKPSKKCKSEEDPLDLLSTCSDTTPAVDTGLSMVTPGDSNVLPVARRHSSDQMDIANSDESCARVDTCSSKSATIVSDHVDSDGAEKRSHDTDVPTDSQTNELARTPRGMKLTSNIGMEIRRRLKKIEDTEKNGTYFSQRMAGLERRNAERLHVMRCRRENVPVTAGNLTEASDNRPTSTTTTQTQMPSATASTATASTATASTATASTHLQNAHISSTHDTIKVLADYRSRMIKLQETSVNRWENLNKQRLDLINGMPLSLGRAPSFKAVSKPLPEVAPSLWVSSLPPAQSQSAQVESIESQPGDNVDPSGGGQGHSGQGPSDVIDPDVDRVAAVFPDVDRNWAQMNLKSMKARYPDNYLTRMCSKMADIGYQTTQGGADATTTMKAGGKHRSVNSGASLEQIRTSQRYVHVLSGIQTEPEEETQSSRKRPPAEPMEVSEIRPSKIKVLQGCEDDFPYNADGKTGNEDTVFRMECEGCTKLTSTRDLSQCNEGHLMCRDCVEACVKDVLSTESKTTIMCCILKCTSSIGLAESKKVLPKFVVDLLQERLDKKERSCISKMSNIVSCPDCGVSVMMEDWDKQFQCPNTDCMTACCRHCKRAWNGINHTICSRLLSVPTVTDAAKLPHYWDAMPSDFSEDYLRVIVRSDCDEYNIIHSHFLRSMKRYTMLCLTRIQNPKLWQKYGLARTHILEDFGSQKLNENHLFHGTNPTTIDAICKEGFDWRLSGQHATSYGQGSYFAVDAAYSHKYAVGIVNRHLHKETPIFNGGFILMVARVVCGRYTMGDKNLRRPPPDPSDVKQRPFNSVVNNMARPGMYVTFDSAQTYPEYVIEYR